LKSYLAILAASLAVAAVGVVLCMHGEADDAPGLVAIGLVLIVAGFAFGIRTAQRSGG
jgi:hypothetical protein